MPYFHDTPLRHKQLLVMSVGTKVGVVVLHNDKRAVACDARPGINNLTCSRCRDRVAPTARDINAFMDVRGEGSDYLPARRPPPSRHGTIGFDRF